LYMSGFLLRDSIWINPGPILVAVFFKNLLGSRASVKHGAHDESGVHDGWIAKNDFILVSPFVIVAVLELLLE